MNRISNIDDISKEHMDDADAQWMMRTVRVGNALGSEKIYVNMDYVKPGGKSAKYHTHSLQEEFFFVMAGTGILRMNGEEIAVKPGDVISKPAGRDIAHQFINNGLEVLQILDVGTREKGDIAVYPDENVILVRDKQQAFHIDGQDAKWTSDPNV